MKCDFILVATLVKMHKEVLGLYRDSSDFERGRECPILGFIAILFLSFRKFSRAVRFLSPNPLLMVRITFVGAEPT